VTKPNDTTAEPRDVILTANMTLRDYFASQVVAQIYEQCTTTDQTFDDVATLAYELADAMLRAREAP
jgi:hypothetical protein